MLFGFLLSFVILALLWPLLLGAEMTMPLPPADSAFIWGMWKLIARAVVVVWSVLGMVHCAGGI